MAIATGDRLPAATFRRFGSEGMVEVPSDQLFGGRKVVLFAVPGAFTPTCNEQHLPGFLAKADAIKAKGVDEIVCISVNDPFVLRAWQEKAGVGDKVTLLSDGNVEFTRAIGMDIDLGKAGLGVRSKRYVMLVEDGVVKELMVEENPGVVEASGADHILEKL